MKKIISLLLALCLMIGCASALADDLTFTTGGQTGVYYAFGNILAQYISNNTDLNVTAVAGNGSADNIDKLEMHVAQLAFVQNDVAHYAAEGIRFEQYEGMPVECFTAIAALYTEAVQLVTVDPEIKSVADLKGKAVSIGAQGSGVYFNAVDFLAAYGMTEDDIQAQYLSFGDSAEALKDEKIAAAFVVAGAPTPAVMDLSTAKSIQLINLDDEAIARLQEINPAYTKAVIPANTYAGQEEDAVTVGIMATIIANDQVTDEQAYTIISTIFENKEAIAEAHAKGQELDLEYAAASGLPYHEGALKYFAEKGIEVK